MAKLEKGQFGVSEVRAFRDGDFANIGAALVDGDGNQTGTATAPLHIASGDIFERIEIQLRIMNLHLAQITDQDFSEEDF